MAKRKNFLPADQQANGNGNEIATLGESEQKSSSITNGSEVLDSISLAHRKAMEIRKPQVSIEQDSPGTVDELQQTPALNWPVVAIGASAGGLQAFRELLQNLPPDTGMAFVLITHLAPDHKSFMSEILAKHTAMPVLPIEAGVEPQPNHLYVLLPNENATIEGGKFRISERPLSSRPNMPVDLFFRSLAADQKNYAVGIILSGADSDGSSGSKTIKGEGGITLAQSPETAQHPGMPRSSIAFDHVDLVLAPDEIGRELARIASQFFIDSVQSLEDGYFAAEGEADDFASILQMLRNLAGIEFRLYKPQTLRRRIARRMVLLRLDSLADYLKYLRGRSEELKILHEEVLINVTRFFRDPDFWHSMQIDVLPSFFKDRATDKPVRIWCAGCSSGEEAYSLAICVLEYLSLNGLETPVQIFGTDASDRSIEMARTAIYPESLMSELSPERIRRYFVKVDRGFQVSKRVRDTCIFARQNLSNDPPFSHIDILSCRNVLIYFNQILQRQIMMTFHYALEPAGYMLLGMSETLREYSGMFSTVDRKNKIYTKIGSSTGGGFDLPRYFARSLVPSFTPSKEPYNQWHDLDLQRAADRIVLARFSPPGLIVDADLNVLQVRGQTAAFVELPTGSVTWNLLRILREEIASQIRERVQHAIKDNVAVTISPVHLTNDALDRDLQIDVLPLAEVGASSRYFMIVFQAANQAKGAAPALALPPAPLTENEKDALSAQLRLDLSTTRFHLQSLIEERDAHNQELVSANEEIQSANEELQSSNEELETTKEELQSANEELQTVNEELQQRNLVLTQTGNDLSNLLNSVNIPLLMLTSDLKIRQFTPPMQRLLNVRDADVGRSISEIRLQLSVEDIEPILLDVLDTLGTREIEVQDRDGKWNLLRVRPYRTAENHIEGLVVVLVDIDQLRRSQQDLLESRDFVSSVVESVPVPIVVLNKDCTIRTNNTAFRELARTQGQDLRGRSLPDLVNHNWGIDGFVDRLNELLASNGSRLEFEHHSTTSDRKILLIKGQALFSGDSRIILLLIEDITARRDTENLLAKQKLALEEKVVTAAHALDRSQEELRGLTGYLFTVQEEERQRVSRELHDDVSQRLSFLELMLNDGKQDDSPEERERKTSTLREHIQTLNTDVRQISHRLHPALLDDLGLATALRALVQEFGEREGMPSTFIAQDVPDLAPQLATIAIYRITQEALRNVAKHAGKTHVKVVLKGSLDSLHLEIVDLGVGFDQESDLRSDGLGIISMQERARLAQGTFLIESTLGMGTKIVVDVPLAPHA
jgi:two-component system CheB/CheR fusion protein